MKFTALLGFLGLAAATAPESDNQLSVFSSDYENTSDIDLIRDDARVGRVARAAFGGDDTSFTWSNRNLLQTHDFYNKNLVRDEKVAEVKISWKQFSRCWSSCSEMYTLYKYKEQGGNADRRFFVYFAPGVSAPWSMNTNGYSSGSSKLHFGYTYMAGTATNGSKMGLIFFVVHPNSWGPYQKRFATNSLTGAALNVVAMAADKGGAAAGAAIGTALGGPLGTVVGAGVGLLAGDAADRFSGDYLRYIG